jgi:hypothetical protein
VIHIHLGVDQCLAALEMVYQDKAGAVEVTDFFGRDETLAHLSFACAETLSVRTAGNAKRVPGFAHLLAIYIAEKYTNVASPRPDYRGGLPIARLRKIEVKFQQRYEKRHGSFLNLLCAKELCLRGAPQLSARFKQPILGA